MSEDDNKIIDEAVKEEVWNQYFPKIRFGVIFNLMCSAILFGVLICTCPVFSEWLHGYYPYLGYEFIGILVLLLVNTFLILTGGKKARLDIIWWITLINAIISIVIFVMFKKEAGHLTTYEERAYYILLIEAAIHVLTGIGITKWYKEI